MRGHGHVVPNEDGSRARCGGPTMCKECAKELAELMSRKPATPLDLNYYRELAKSVPIRERPSFTTMAEAILELCAEVERLRKIPEGYVLVPVEPTLAMISCGRMEANRHSPQALTDGEKFVSVYKAMIAAAPKDKP